MTLDDIDRDVPRLHDMIAGWVGHGCPRVVLDACTGLVAVLPMRGEATSEDELKLACMLHLALCRGVLVLA